MAVPQQQIEQFTVVSNPGQPAEAKEATFESRLLTAAREHYDLTRSSRARRYYLWLVTSLFAKAIHYVHYNQSTGVVQEWSQERISQCMYTPVPLLYYAVENLAAQYTNSNPTIEPMPATEQDPKMKAVVRSLKDFADYLDFEFYRRTPHQRQTEAKLIPLRGVYSFLEWDRKGGAKIKLPQYEPQQAMMCADCGYEVGNESGATVSSGVIRGGAAPVPGGVDGDATAPPQGDLAVGGSAGAAVGMGSRSAGTGMAGTGSVPGGQGVCAHCGSVNLQPQVTGIANKGTVAGRQGCVKRHVVDPFQVEIFDRTKGIEESPYLIYDEVIFKTKALRDYPWLKSITGNISLGNSQEGFLGLHYLMQLETVISNTGQLDQSKPEYSSGSFTAGYQGTFLHDKLCWRRRCWLDPEEYSGDDWVTSVTKVVQLPGIGKLIPPNTKARDMFPDGMLIHIINGQVVKLENQCKNSVWSYVGYRVPAEGLHGPGVNPLVSLNRGYDEANSFEMQALLMSALGIIVADERIKNVRNIPGSIATIPLSARLPGESIDTMMKRLDMGGGQAIAAAEPVKQGLRGHIGDLSMAANPNGYGNRPQGVGGETATAVKYNAGATSTLTGPPMELYAASKAVVIQQAVQLERLYNLRPRMFGKFGDSVVRWLEPMDIPEDCPFGPAEDSWRPRTLENQREDIANCAQTIGVLGPEGDKAVVDKAKRVFGLDEEVEDYEDWAVRGEKWLDAMKRALPAVLAEEAQIQAMSAQIPEVQESESPIQETAEGPQGEAQEAAPPSPSQRLIQVAGVTPRPLDMQGHEHYCRFWVEIYNSDEFDSFHPILQDAIEEMYGISQDGMGKAGAVLTDQMTTAQGPALAQQQQMAAQQQQQLAQQEQQAQAAEQQHEKELEAGKLQVEAARQTQDAELKREQAAKDAEQQHRIDDEKARAEIQRDDAKAAHEQRLADQEADAEQKRKDSELEIQGRQDKTLEDQKFQHALALERLKNEHEIEMKRMELESQREIAKENAKAAKENKPKESK